jgi:hypothetical protein
VRHNRRRRQKSLLQARDFWRAKMGLLQLAMLVQNYRGPAYERSLCNVAILVGAEGVSDDPSWHAAIPDPSLEHVCSLRDLCRLRRL